MKFTEKNWCCILPRVIGCISIVLFVVFWSGCSDNALQTEPVITEPNVLSTVVTVATEPVITEEVVPDNTDPVGDTIENFVLPVDIDNVIDDDNVVFTLLGGGRVSDNDVIMDAIDKADLGNDGYYILLSMSVNPGFKGQLPQGFLIGSCGMEIVFADLVLYKTDTGFNNLTQLCIDDITDDSSYILLCYVEYGVINDVELHFITTDGNMAVISIDDNLLAEDVVIDETDTSVG